MKGNVISCGVDTDMVSKQLRKPFTTRQPGGRTACLSRQGSTVIVGAEMLNVAVLDHQGQSSGIRPDATPDVLFIEDVARILRTSRSTIERRRRAGTFPIPELPSIDEPPSLESTSRRKILGIVGPWVAVASRAT